MPPLRRSARLRGLSALAPVSVGNISCAEEPLPRKRAKAKTTGPRVKIAKRQSIKKEQDITLPRTRENELLSSTIASSSSDCYTHVIGIDEAGRGPLAGPVVAAAVCCSMMNDTLPGVTDSKKIKEEDREKLYEQITQSRSIRWAVAVITAARIDQINILQATLEGMKLAATAVVMNEFRAARVPEATIQEKGCYVVCGQRTENGDVVDFTTRAMLPGNKCYALIDGNRLPKEMPCEAETIVKGDSKEYAIAVASILAKVTRDRLMSEYHKLYPEYGLEQNKGYPTAAHMAAVRKFGASPIHRRTFAPLKHMEFDADGKTVEN